MGDFDKVPMLEPYTVMETATALSESTDYNHVLMNIPEMWKKTRGAGVKVAVLDTGAPRHIDIKIAGERDFSGGASAIDKAGHGSHVAGIINAIAGNGIGVKGIAPDAQLYCGKVLCDDGSGSIDAIARGIYWAVDTVGADIINMSLGCSARNGVPATLKSACEYAYSHGVTIFAAAGNDAGAVNAPACLPTTISVSAIDRSKKSASFTCHGDSVDFAAGGVDVFSTWLDNAYAKLSGTSMASPALAGVGALIVSDLKASGLPHGPKEVYSRMLSIVEDIGAAGKDEYTGHGIPIFRQSSSMSSGQGGSVIMRLVAWVLGVFGIRVKV